MTLFKPKRVSSTPFSEFIRNAPSQEKKRVYTHVLKKASESQREVIDRAVKGAPRKARA